MKQIDVSGFLFFRAFRFAHLWKHTLFFLVALAPLGLIAGFFELPLVNRYPGQIRLQPDLTLHSSDKSGIVSEIHVSQGAKVKAAEKLITLRSVATPNQVSLDSALESISGEIKTVRLAVNVLEEQRATAQTMAIGKKTKIQTEIDQINIELASMAPELKLFVSMAERFRTLYQKGAASKHELESHEINLKSFERSMTSKRISLDALNTSLQNIDNELKQKFKEFEAQTTAKLNEIDNLERRHKALSKSEIWTVNAQRSGTVTAINIVGSEQISPGQRLIDIVGPDSVLEIDFYQPIQKKTNLVVGSGVKVAIDAYPTEVHGLFDANISIVGQSPTKVGASFKHTAIFPKEALSSLPPIKDGYSVMVSVLVDELTIYQWLLAPFLTPEY